MLAKKKLTDKFIQWNVRQGAPFGHDVHPLIALFPAKLLQRALSHEWLTKLSGPFSIQPNNTTRKFEYPWAYYVTPLQNGMHVLDLGGGLSGFQFVLSKLGCHVVNVDPGSNDHEFGCHCENEAMNRLNKCFGTKVRLINKKIIDADLFENSFDRVFSISVIEHIPEEELPETVSRIFELLKPGGLFVVTLDLFLNVRPFSSRTENRFGSNINVRRLVEAAPFELVVGNTRELYGYDEFDVGFVLGNLEEYLIGEGYPALVQCLVLRKPLS